MIFVDSSSGAVICVGACSPVKKKVKMEKQHGWVRSSCFSPCLLFTLSYSFSHLGLLRWVYKPTVKFLNSRVSVWLSKQRHVAPSSALYWRLNGEWPPGGYVWLSWNLRSLKQAAAVSNGSPGPVIGQTGVKTDVHSPCASTAIPAWASDSSAGNLLCSHN